MMADHKNLLDWQFTEVASRMTSAAGLLKPAINTELAAYRFLLKGDRINKEGMYFYLTDVSEKASKVLTAEMIANRAQILDSVLFQTRGNIYLKAPEMAQKRLQNIIKNCLPTSVMQHRSLY